MKRGQQGEWGKAVLKMSRTPTFKLLLSGTPITRNEEDLVAQYQFLSPAEAITRENVVAKFGDNFVRTTKDELELPPREIIFHDVPMGPAQAFAYNIIKGKAVAELGISRGAKRDLRKMAKCAMLLLQVASNPGLLSERFSASECSQVNEMIRQEVIPKGKIRRLLRRALNLVNEGKKVLIWTTFVKNVEAIAKTLRDPKLVALMSDGPDPCLGSDGALFIHGKTDLAERNRIVREFNHNPSARVLVANPASCGEGVSLHHACHNALYLDRTYNAAHFIQSQDRIHRVGLAADTVTTIEVFQSLDTIDMHVHNNLNKKMDIMEELLNDPSIRPTPVINGAVMDDGDEESAWLDENDCDDEFLKYLGVPLEPAQNNPTNVS
jgi:SNF2 family DNA or RNA helicase